MYRQGLMAATGDYYTGDPGWFGNLLKGAIGMIPGVGTVAKAAINILAPSKQSPIGATLPPPPMVRFPGLPGVRMPLPRGSPFTPFSPARPRGTVRTGWEQSKSQIRALQGLPPLPRRMNVTNAKALRRAIRRARGFEKLARRVIGFSSPRKPTGRTYFRKTRARK